MNINELKFKKYPVLDQGFICLVDAMGDDAAICQAARVSYDKDILQCKTCNGYGYVPGTTTPFPSPDELAAAGIAPCPACTETSAKDRNLIRYLLNHNHTSPFEQVEIKFMVQAPMDCWRQWIRHRTANVNEYSTRYTEAIDMCQTTAPDQWRLQATDNKQGSSGFLTEWPSGWYTTPNSDGDSSVGMPDSCNVVFEGEGFKFTDYQAGPYDLTAGQYLTNEEESLHAHAKRTYNLRLQLGVAKEQARKDLPLSTYTRAYWKCDLHNIFNFLRLRMDSHAQLEIRSYANAMYEIVKQIVPVACEAFEDYVLNAKKFSAMEMDILKQMVQHVTFEDWNDISTNGLSDRELKEFKKKVGI